MSNNEFFQLTTAILADILLSYTPFFQCECQQIQDFYLVAFRFDYVIELYYGDVEYGYGEFPGHLDCWAKQ